MNTLVDKKELGAAKILLIDDEEIVHLTIARILKSDSYDIEHAYSAQEGLNKINNEYDLIICDVIMPGLNGINVLKNIKNKNYRAKVIMLSGFASKKDEEEALANNALFYITKPIEDIAKFKTFIADVVR